MCGVCGVVDYSNSSVRDNRASVERMVTALHHRGPDFHDMWIQEPALLGHSRLAVIDLSSGANQPMQSEDGRYVLVFNGEIYNFKDLRRLLVFRGCTFKTDSDTEVLLQLYSIYGNECVSKLSGMFAFAVWDKKAETLFVARDRFGQKPFFYYTKNRRFAFASELNALLEDEALVRKPNPNAIYHYLTVQSVPAPMCAFKGVNKLGPGECLLFGRSGVRKWRYWTPSFRNSFLGSEGEAVEELDLLLNRAVSTHLESDVPLGLFLSGGVDSSLVSAIACRNHSDMRSFSMGFGDRTYDERPYAREVSTFCGTIHHDEEASSRILDLLPSLVRHYGEPYADSSAVPTWLLSEMTAKHVTVALSGDGGDDLFGGYERYLNPFLFLNETNENQHVADLIKELKEELSSYCDDDSIRDCLIDAGTAKYHFHWARFCGQRKIDLASKWLKEAAIPSLTLSLMLEHFMQSSSANLLDKIQLFEIDYYLASTLMTKVDIASMAHSLEVRAPFLDNEVADFALSLPAEMRVRKTSTANGGSFGKGFEAKWLLKKVAAKYLPLEIVYRRKMGFGVPIGDWFKGGLCDLLKDTLLSDSCKNRGWLEAKTVEVLVNEHLQGKANHQYGLWALLMLELWAEEYF
ncbi:MULTISPECIES: asparagine synthase (glutamine-hydrolyzing) [unclassified Maridesulfovibrio]|uniref:asparagine synthase (glutamine-hydrolyzing) n=1 Tax=unclassified Maridesulfovibrio TaxID=2794999 RepID=UPI003B3C7F8F